MKSNGVTIQMELSLEVLLQGAISFFLNFA